MQITFEGLTKIPVNDIVELMNHPLLRRHMPLLGEGFSDADCARFISSKESLWAEHGYGPWAFLVGGVFAGWGGFQWENGDPDVALVLHPRHWGLGETIYRKIIAEGFQRWHFDSVTTLLPPGRVRPRVLKRLGFQPDGKAELQGIIFLRFRLHASMATLLCGRRIGGRHAHRCPTD